MQKLTGRWEGIGAPAERWEAGGNISVNLGAVPGTITGLHIIMRAKLTTGASTTWRDDPWDRIIRNLSLTRGPTALFAADNMRHFFHFLRARQPFTAPRRPGHVPNSSTNVERFIHYPIYFGLAPVILNPATGALMPNKFDLTAGIPPTQGGDLILQGSFAPANALGSGITIVDGDLYIYVDQVKPDPGDRPEDWLPMAQPVWSSSSPNLGGTSTAFGDNTEVPGGAWLRRIHAMLTNGADEPRASDVLNSLRLYNNRNSQSIISYGGEANVVEDYKPAELMSQLAFASTKQPSDDGSPLGEPSEAAYVEPGIVDFPLDQYAREDRGGSPAYGYNLTNLNSGDLRLHFGISDATDSLLRLMWERYEILDRGQFPAPDTQPPQ